MHCTLHHCTGIRVACFNHSCSVIKKFRQPSYCTLRHIASKFLRIPGSVRYRVCCIQLRKLQRCLAIVKKSNRKSWGVDQCGQRDWQRINLQYLLTYRKGVIIILISLEKLQLLGPVPPKFSIGDIHPLNLGAKNVEVSIFVLPLVVLARNGKVWVVGSILDKKGY